MNNYEAIFILKPEIEADKLDKKIEDIHERITKKNAVVEKTDKLGKKKLTTPINKNKEGEFLATLFKSEPAAILAIKDLFKLDEDVLRLMVIKK